MSRRSGEGKYDSKSADIGDEDLGGEDSKYSEPSALVVDVKEIVVHPSKKCGVSDPFELKIKFEINRDVVAALWRVQFLVDLAHERRVTELGETKPEDYPQGESEMYFSVEKIDLSGITPNALSNAALLMAGFIVDGEEVVTVNLVVNVMKENGAFVREILNPL